MLQLSQNNIVSSGKYNVNPLTVVASEYLDNALKSDLEYRAGSEIDLDADDVEE